MRGDCLPVASELGCAVASRYGVRFATLDEAAPATLIAGGPAALHVIPAEGA